jgi:hypothetical protein
VRHPVRVAFADEEIDAVLKAINRATVQGSRDYALLATMFNTGAESRRSPICACAISN